MLDAEAGAEQRQGHDVEADVAAPVHLFLQVRGGLPKQLLLALRHKRFGRPELPRRPGLHLGKYQQGGAVPQHQVYLGAAVAVAAGQHLVAQRLQVSGSGLFTGLAECVRSVSHTAGSEARGGVLAGGCKLAAARSPGKGGAKPVAGRTFAPRFRKCIMADFSVPLPAPAFALAATAPAAGTQRGIHVHRLGLVEYVPTWQRQESLMDATLAIRTRNRLGQATGEAPLPTPNHLLLCEHPHTYTLGKSGKPEHLLLDDAALAAHAASFHRINRGGDITYHGPGQLVGYPILDLDNFRPDIHWYLRTLEEAVIRTLAEYGLDAGRIPGLTGVWLDWAEGAPNPRKICALGVKCSRWVTLHGFALNVAPDLSYFGHIVPCGITDKAVTSLAQELGSATISVAEVQERLLPQLLTLLGATIEPAAASANL